MVVAKADHGSDRELQHLRARAGADAAHHGQEIPVTEFVREPPGAQKIAQRLHHRGLQARLGQPGGDAVKANDVAQHAQEFPVDEVAALGKHAVQAAAAPFQALALQGIGHPDRKRHVRRGGCHAQLGKQIDEMGVGALVEHQKTGVHAMADGASRRGQRDVYGVSVAAEVVTGFKQGELGQAVQRVRHGQARDAGADDGHMQGRAAHAGNPTKGQKGWKIKMLRSAPARTREGGRRRSAPGLQLNRGGSEGFATMKLFSCQRRLLKQTALGLV